MFHWEGSISGGAPNVMLSAVHLAQPRPRSGRPGDFCPKYLTSDLHSRRMVRSNQAFTT